MIKRGENMIITNDIAKENFKEYSNKNTKLAREVRDGKLLMTHLLQQIIWHIW